MEIRNTLLLILTAIALLSFPKPDFGQVAPNLGAASGFALFTADGAFNGTGSSSVTGDVGTDKGLFIAFPPGTLDGTKHVADATSAQTKTDVLAAYGALTQGGAVIAVELGGQIHGPGIYTTGAASTLNGTLTLNALGDPNAVFIIRIGGAFAEAGASNVNLINSASACNVYWQIGGQFELAAGSSFSGTAIVTGAIHLYGSSSLFGRALSTTGEISLEANTVNIPIPITPGAITGTQAQCPVLAGQSYNVTSIANATIYTWTIPTGWSITAGIGTKDITVTTGSAGQNGNITVTAGNSCGTSTPSSLVVTVNPRPATSLIYHF